MCLMDVYIRVYHYININTHYLCFIAITAIQIIICSPTMSLSFIYIQERIILVYKYNKFHYVPWYLTCKICWKVETEFRISADWRILLKYLLINDLNTNIYSIMYSYVILTFSVKTITRGFQYENSQNELRTQVIAHVYGPKWFTLPFAVFSPFFFFFISCRPIVTSEPTLRKCHGKKIVCFSSHILPFFFLSLFSFNAFSYARYYYEITYAHILAAYACTLYAINVFKTLFCIRNVRSRGNGGRCEEKNTTLAH